TSTQTGRKRRRSSSSTPASWRRTTPRGSGGSPRKRRSAWCRAPRRSPADSRSSLSSSHSAPASPATARGRTGRQLSVDSLRGGIMKAVLLSLTLSVLLFTSVSAQNLTIVNGFPGDSAIGPKIVPDNVGGVGPEHVVSFTCANFVAHDKKTGKVLLKKTQTEF